MTTELPPPSRLVPFWFGSQCHDAPDVGYQPSLSWEAHTCQNALTRVTKAKKLTVILTTEARSMKKPINGLKAHATDPSVVVDDLKTVRTSLQHSTVYLGGRVLFPIRVFLSSSCSMSPLTGLLFRRLRAYTATERDREARRKPKCQVI